MKTKNILQVFLTTVLISVSLLLNAQTKFYINKKDGTANQYNIADVDSISFAPSSSSTVADPTPLNTNVSLVPSSPNSTDIPIVDVVNRVLDLGANPILIIGNKSFALKLLWPSNPEKYRAIPLTTTATSAPDRVLFFNVATNDFELTSSGGTTAKDANRVLIGTINNPAAGGGAYQINVNLAFPFRYSHIRASVITGSLMNRTNSKISQHRGLNLAGIAPENSLDAAEMAARAGYYAIEGDIQVTSDGELVILHDGILNPSLIKYAADYSDIPNGLDVRNITLADLRANYVLASSNPGMRRPIPTLEEMYLTCRDNHIIPYMEIKSTMSNADILKAYNLAKGILGDENVMFSSSSAGALDYIRTLSDTIDLIYATVSILGTVNSINGQSREHPHNIWGPGSTVTAEQVKEYKRKNMKVCATGTSSTFDDLIKAGVYLIEGGDIGPNLDGRPGYVLTSDGSWKGFSTNGTVSNIITLNNGQYIKWDANNSSYLSAFYVKVIFKGSINLSAPRTAITKTSQSNSSYVLVTQGLWVNNGATSLTITAKADGTQVYKIEFVSVDL